MTPLEHVQKAQRITSSLGHLRTPCPPLEIEAYMLAGTHMVNALLHGMRLREEDLVHCWGFDLPNAAPKVRAALRDLDSIEVFRPLYVRGAEPNPERAAQTAASAYERLASLAESVVR